MYEIRKFKVVNFALIWMFIAAVNYLVIGLLFVLLFTGIMSALEGALFGSGAFGGVSIFGFLGGFLFGLLIVAVVSFLIGLLSAATYNFISARMNKGLQLDIVQLVEKVEPQPRTKNK